MMKHIVAMTNIYWKGLILFSRTNSVKSTQEENISKSWVVILFLTPEDCLKQSM